MIDTAHQFPVDPARVKAVVFDLGGVFLESTVQGVREFGPRHGLAGPAWDAMHDTLFLTGGHWERVERGQESLAVFAQEMVRRFALHGIPLPLERALEFMGSPLERRAMPVRPEIVDICERLRKKVYTALLTNNILEWRAGWRARLDTETLFDAVVDSCEAGTRKPEPAIYELMERQLWLPGNALLFVDDLGVNLKAAAARGWQTVKYGDTGPVLEVLERVLREAGDSRD